MAFFLVGGILIFFMLVSYDLASTIKPELIIHLNVCVANSSYRISRFLKSFLI